MAFTVADMIKVGKGEYKTKTAQDITGIPDVGDEIKAYGETYIVAVVDEEGVWVKDKEGKKIYIPAEDIKFASAKEEKVSSKKKAEFPKIHYRIKDLSTDEILKTTFSPTQAHEWLKEFKNKGMNVDIIYGSSKPFTVADLIKVAEKEHKIEDKKIAQEQIAIETTKAEIAEPIKEILEKKGFKIKVESVQDYLKIITEEELDFLRKATAEKDEETIFKMLEDAPIIGYDKAELIEDKRRKIENTTDSFLLEISDKEKIGTFLLKISSSSEEEKKELEEWINKEAKEEFDALKESVANIGGKIKGVIETINQDLVKKAQELKDYQVGYKVEGNWLVAAEDEKEARELFLTDELKDVVADIDWEKAITSVKEIVEKTKEAQKFVEKTQTKINESLEQIKPIFHFVLDADLFTKMQSVMKLATSREATWLKFKVATNWVKEQFSSILETIEKIGG